MCWFRNKKIAIRLICGAKYNSHTEPLFKISRILPLPLLIEFFKLQFMNGFLNNLLPSSFDNMWTVNAARRLCDQPILRNHYSLFLPTSRLSSTEKFPLLNFPHLWSNFPDTNIKQITSRAGITLDILQTMVVTSTARISATT